MEGLPGKSICFNNKLWHNQRKGAVMTDFANNENKELVRIYKNLKNGTAVIGELVHAGEGRGIDLRLGLGKKACRFMRNTENKAPSAGISYTFGLKKDLRGKKSR